MNGRKRKRENGTGKGICGSLWSLCLSACVLVSLGLPLPALAAKYAGGSGTTADPFLIATAADFQAIGENPADWDKRFKLTQNIDLSGYNEKTLHMIGRYVAYGSPNNQPFTGVFDGNGKTISNFRYRNLVDAYVGLFQHVSGIIQNLTLVRPIVTGNQSGTGSLVGCLEKGALSQCTATKVNVRGNEQVGGLVGYVNGSVNYSCSDGYVAGALNTGGLIGMLREGNVYLSYSKALVEGWDSTGGLIGATASLDAIVGSCYAQGEVKGKQYAGGLVGQVAPGYVSHCYSVGKVTGNQGFVGGLVGYQRGLGDVLGSVWDTKTSTQATSFGGTGKTTEQMKLVDTFVAQNWDFGFDRTWMICEGIGYPVLVWQIPKADLVCPDGVDFHDFAWFAAQWGNQDCFVLNFNCEGADLDLSGAVDFQDLAIFAQGWLAGL
jgi:hypothetical protein